MRAATSLRLRASAFWFALLVSSVAPLRADLTLVQKTESGLQVGEQTIRIQGLHARIDIADEISVLLDRQTGETLTFAHAQKRLLRLSAAQAAAMLAQMRERSGVTAPAKLQPSGRKEKVGGFPCEVFTCTVGAITVTFWLAKDYPNYAAILAQMDVIESSSLSAMTAGLMPPAQDFPGMKMKTVLEISGRKIVTTLVSLREEPVDPAIFLPPEDYDEQSLPAPPPIPSAAKE